jgi:hypothetical protein
MASPHAHAYAQAQASHLVCWLEQRDVMHLLYIPTKTDRDPHSGPVNTVTLVLCWLELWASDTFCYAHKMVRRNLLTHQGNSASPVVSLYSSVRQKKEYERRWIQGASNESCVPQKQGMVLSVLWKYRWSDARPVMQSARLRSLSIFLFS